jgi:hypothetical protein
MQYISLNVCKIYKTTWPYFVEDNKLQFEIVWYIEQYQLYMF